ncbi:trypsin-like peptidase domain-containing protein [Kitasatospora sp. MMS16-BH015]|uniref:nSTAND1 domain-containing NTPase n=1 Tax=Kitasatospora sp. MMS16-BH015 TaxID=2018025 RepID=UPI00131A4B47|nr:trypsin-like peptidase domain-containing protein [Kitasatospora sp. MMS16-BH015]
MTGVDAAALAVPEALEAALVRIYGQSGAPVGVGFLISDRLVLTCAHVVSTALGLPIAQVPPPDAWLALDAPMAGGPESPERERGSVRVWGPAQPVGADLAVLDLEHAPVGTRPAWLVDTQGQQLWGHEARVFGLPQGRSAGVWHQGVLRARQADGWTQIDLAGEGYRVSPGFSGSAVWDQELGGVVGLMAAAETGNPPVSYMLPASLLFSCWPELRSHSLPPSPFRGLSPFLEGDAGLFFGRDGDADTLASVTVAERWTTVVGPSGCGKSSLAMAGVGPRRRRAGDCTVVVRFAWYDSPLRALAAALLPLLGAEPGDEAERFDRITDLAAHLGAHGVRESVFRILERHGASRLLVIVDQLEELLTHDDDGIGQLAEVLCGPATPAELAVLATLRADLLDTALTHPVLGPVVSRRVHALEPMRPEQLSEVVSRPVDTVPGVFYEEALAERILADAGADPGVLPLLGFTLDLLWRRRDGWLITHQKYARLGGVAGALGRYADEVWEAVVPAREADVAERLLTRLVRMPLGAAAPVRRAVHRSEVDAAEWAVAERLAQRRLLVIQGRGGTETAELAHEALITAWARTRDLTTADRAFLAWRESAQTDLDRWEHAKRPADLLPTRTALAAARQWLPARSGELSAALRDFLDRGRRRNRRRRGTLTSVVAAVCALLLAAAALGVSAQRNHRDAAHNAAINRANTLATDAAALASSDPGLAAQLAVAAFRSAPTQAAVDQLYASIAGPLDQVLASTGSPVVQVVAQAHGPLVAASSESGSVRVWDTGHLDTPHLVSTLPSTKGGAIALAPRAPQLAALCPDQDGLCLISLSDPQHPARLGQLPTPHPWPSGELTLTSLAFNPDGTLLAGATDAGSSLLWSTTDPTHPSLLSTLPGKGSGKKIGAVAFSPDGRTLAATNQDGTTQLWNLTTPAKPAPAAAIPTGYQSLAFSPDGAWLAGAGDLRLDLWKTSDPSTPIEADPLRTVGDLMSVSFSPNGGRIAWGGTGINDSNSAMCLTSVQYISPDKSSRSAPRPASTATPSRTPPAVRSSPAEPTEPYASGVTPRPRRRACQYLTAATSGTSAPTATWWQPRCP